MDISQLKQRQFECQDLSVLYIRNKSLTRDATVNLLRRLFSDIDLSENYDKGWNRVKDNDYDIVIIDLHFNNTPGLELSRKIVLNRPKQNLFLITTTNDFNNLIEPSNIRICDIIKRPILPNDFLTLFFENAKKIIKNQQEKNHTLISPEYKSEFFKINSSLIKILKSESKKALIQIQITNFDELAKIYNEIELDELFVKVNNILLNKVNVHNFKLYRLSFLEFILIKDDYDDQEELLKDISNKIANFFETYILTNENDNKKYFIEPAIGIVSGNNKLLKKAMQAVHYAKEENIKYYFHQNNDTKDLEKIELKNFLKYAIKNDLITPVFQSIVSREKKVTKYEVLMRIQRNPDNEELISPLEFLSFAKDEHLYNQLSEILIYKAIDFMLKVDINLSLNFSYFDILNESLNKKIEELILEHNIGNRLVFEITENEMIENFEVLNSFVKRFKNLGVKIAIDDFGTGYSNFDRILKVEPNYIKIDGSLIKNIIEDKVSYKIVDIIIKLAHSLNIMVIAEYVYKKEIFDLLCELKVDEFQGYYLGSPSLELK